MKLELTTAALCRHLEVHETIASTNDRARQLAAEHAPHGTTVVAHAQTGGRGRRGRQWHSPKGAGLYVSFLIRTELPPADAPALTFMSAVATNDAIRAATGVDTGVKWPNDILASASRKKVAGILVEVSSSSDHIDHAIIGVGVNLHRQQWPEAIAEYATSLEDLGGVPEVSVLLAKLAHTMEAGLQRLANGGPTSIIDAWSTAAIGLGEAVEISDGPNPCSGTFTGVTAQGALIIDTAEGRREVHVGDLHLGGAPRPTDR